MKSFIYSISIINKMQSDILKITDIPLVDETIERYEFHEYEPTARTNLNTAGEFRINIELQDLFSHPSESYLQFEGRLTETNNTAYVNADAVTLTNNGLMHLSVRYRILYLIKKLKRYFTQVKQRRCLDCLSLRRCGGRSSRWKSKHRKDLVVYAPCDSIRYGKNAVVQNHRIEIVIVGSLSRSPV